MAAGDTPDIELLERWRDGDSRAGEVLAGRYFMVIRAYFLNKAPAVHEDLVQETFVRLASKLDRYRGASSFRTFIFGIARMILLEYLRSKRRDARFDPMEQSAVDIEGGRMSSVIARQQSHQLVLEALRELPLVDQELLELYYWQKLTAGDIAEILQLPVPTVRSRIRAALKRVNQGYGKLASSPARGDDELEGWLGELRQQLAGLSVSLVPAG